MRDDRIQLLDDRQKAYVDVVRREPGLPGLHYSIDDAEEEGHHRTKYPHCDDLVLHAPGVCQACDLYPDRQALRRAFRIAFTGETPTADQAPCPAEMVRSARKIHLWGGNRPDGYT